MATYGYPGVPVSNIRDIRHVWPTLVRVVNNLLIGKSNNVITFTLTANAASSTITDPRVGSLSFLGFMPTTANAAAELGNGTLYVSSRGSGTATVVHANNAQADRTYAVVIVG